MSTNLGFVLLAFAVYLIMMIVVGILSMSKTNSTEDYFLGGRGLNGWVAALSAQASDMSGWLLMGLPGSVYALGTGQAWVAIGLFLGTVANWLFISKRLRRYTIVANNSLTLPEFLENRYHDKKRVLLFISSVVIVVFFLVYTASALSAGGKLFNRVLGVDYHVALAIGAVVILIYTFLGGFLAVCTTDFIQGTLMLVGLMVVPLAAYAMVGGDFVQNIVNTGLPYDNGTAAAGMTYQNYMSLFYNGSTQAPYTFVEILSQLAWGLGYCGMPHILVRFMAIKNEKELKKSSVIAIVWVFISLVAAILIGVIGRAFLGGNLEDSENVFIEMIRSVFENRLSMAFVGGIFLCGILAAIMSTADSQLLVCASSVSRDIFQNILRPKADDKTVLKVSRTTVIVVAVLAFVVAWDPNSSIMELVSDAWAGLGSAFGPVVVCSLFWKRTNFAGAVAGILSGGATVILWDYIPVVQRAGEWMKLKDITGIYSLLVGFFVSLLFIVVFSLLTKEPSREIMMEFEKVNAAEKDFE